MDRRFPLVVVLPLSLLLAACQPAALSETPRSVTVTGEGEISVVPEIATVRLAVEARDREMAAAQARAGETVNAVLALADALKIPRARVQSSQLRVQPEYDWNDGQQEFRGYLVQRDISIELEDLSLLGPLIERALAAGVTTISPPELGVKNPRKLHRDVLQAAAADAKANAEALAQTLESTLGKLRHVTAVEDGVPPVPMMEMRMMKPAADSMAAEGSYTAGRIVMRARVQAEFGLR